MMLFKNLKKILLRYSMDKNVKEITFLGHISVIYFSKTLFYQSISHISLDFIVTDSERHIHMVGMTLFPTIYHFGSLLKSNA